MSVNSKDVRAQTQTYDAYLNDDNLAGAASGRGILVEITEDLAAGRLKKEQITGYNVSDAQEDVKNYRIRYESARSKYQKEQNNVDFMCKQKDRWLLLQGTE